LEQQERSTIAYVHERTIDKRAFDADQARINAELDRVNAAMDELAVEGDDCGDLLRFAEALLTQPDRWWSDSEGHHKAVLQQVFFPSGLPFGPEGFGTAEPCPFFGLNEASASQNDELASPTGFEPVFWP
jgi:hypothetical protein